MTTGNFERRMRQLVDQGELEGPARLRVGLDKAGYGGDVSGTPVADEDPVALIDRLGGLWRPLPARESRLDESCERDRKTSLGLKNQPFTNATTKRSSR